MHLVASGLAHEGRLRIGLDALGDNTKIESASERDDGSYDRRLFGIRLRTVDERTIDLEPLDGKRLQIRERRIAGSEVVDADLHIERA